MVLNKSITLLSIATLCSSFELVPFAPYAGQHIHNCMKYDTFTGKLLNDKIYTFGGCYPMPLNMGAPDEPDSYNRLFNSLDPINTTDTAYAYDIQQDKWELETHTPVPLNGAKTLVVGNDIYFYNMNKEDVYRRNNDLWKYDTITKEWTILIDELPFIWSGQLVACENNGIIYMSGTKEAIFRNIIQRYDTKTKEWKAPLLLNKKLNIDLIICYPDSIQIGGKQLPRTEKFRSKDYYNFENEPEVGSIDFFTVSYENGNTELSDFTVTGNLKSGYFSRISGWQYFIDVRSKKSKVIKVNPTTKQTVELGHYDLAVRRVVMSVYKDQEVYLLGGIVERDIYNPEDKEITKIITLNHKFRINDDTVNQQDVDTTNTQKVIRA